MHFTSLKLAKNCQAERLDVCNRKSIHMQTFHMTMASFWAALVAHSRESYPKLFHVDRCWSFTEGVEVFVLSEKNLMINSDTPVMHYSDIAFPVNTLTSPSCFS